MWFLMELANSAPIPVEILSVEKWAVTPWKSSHSFQTSIFKADVNFLTTKIRRPADR